MALAAVVLTCCASSAALDPSLDISQYAHTAWTFRDGFPLGNIFAIAQTSDGYLWLGGEFGLFRFDGVRAVPWQPPAGQYLPDRFAFRLLSARDGTLWIGTFSGLVTWDGARLTRHPELDGRIVGALLEDHEGTVWAATLDGGGEFARLCAMRRGSTQCFGDDGALGRTVTALYEDPSGTLWVSAESGLWRWRPGPPRRQSTGPQELTALTEMEDGRTLIASYGAGLMQIAGDKLQAYPIRAAIGSNRLLRDREVDANKLLRDRDGGLWIGTVEHGLIHVYHGRTDVFSKSDGLSGDVVLSLFEDREGNVWVSSKGGLDRFHQFPVTTLSFKQGLASDDVGSVLADRHGSAWVGTHEGLTRWKNGQTTTFRKANGLPDDHLESLFQDDRGRLWVYAGHELAYFDADRFIALHDTVPSEDVYSITGDKQGNLWLAGNKGLSHLQETRLVEHFPWSALGRHEQAKVLVADQGGVWLSFWKEGAVSYFKNGRLRASYTAADGLGKGRVANLQLDGDRALWAATDEGGLSRIKDEHIATLSSRNGLPCDMIHWSIEDNDHSLWLYTACGLVRIARTELVAWIADPQHRVETTVLDAADGVRLRSVSPSAYSPTVSKSTDGRLWFLSGEGIQVVNPHRLSVNKLPPAVHIEKIDADHTMYWQNLPGSAVSEIRLPPLIHDLTIDYTALSLVAPEKVHFKFKLEGQDRDWREVVNDRQVQYTNLRPGPYRFRVIACNNSGVWNEQGDTLDFTIPPAWYQTLWFRVVCAAVFLLLLWAIYQGRVHETQEREKKFREAVESMPALAFVADTKGNRRFVNRGWLEYTGLSPEEAFGTGWHKAIHPDDLKRVLERWHTAQATGQPLAYEARIRRGADGTYRWFQTRARPLFDRRGNVLKWCAVATDIEDRKRAEELQAELAHVNRVSTMGELAASISHELNQPIAAAIMNAALALQWLHSDPPDLTQVHERTTRIIELGKLASAIIDRLRSLYKKEPPKRESVAVNEVIGEMVELLRGQATRHGVSLRADLANDVPGVIADRVQIQQVLMNLMLNGIEAMSDTGGVLTVKSQLREHGQIEISVNDTGPGLPPGKADQIFDAFFTTKPQGSGMGLAISKSIVESHGGRIWANPEGGHGATFHFTLPAAPVEADIPVSAT